MIENRAPPPNSYTYTKQPIPIEWATNTGVQMLVVHCARAEWKADVTHFRMPSISVKNVLNSIVCAWRPNQMKKRKNFLSSLLQFTLLNSRTRSVLSREFDVKFCSVRLMKAISAFRNGETFTLIFFFSGFFDQIEPFVLIHSSIQFISEPRA